MSNSAAFARKREALLNEMRSRFDDFELTRDSLAFVGAALYWAEGQAKGDLIFSNSDCDMIRVYIRWLFEVLGLKRDEVTCQVSVHLTNGITYDQVEDYWKCVLGWNAEFSKPTVFNHPDRGTKIGKLPHGVLRVRAKKPQRYIAAFVALAEKLGKDPSDFVGT